MKQFYKWLIGLGMWTLAIQHSSATHIVGGEIELEVVKNEPGASHRVSLNLYFDAINGNAQAEDLNITLYFFRKSDNNLMGTASLPRVSNSLIPYTSPACVRGDLQTRLIRYSALLSLPPENFNDAKGYYIAWERCCRNNIITNITDPGGAGSVFYLEFPALRKDGKDFLNSSPHFDPIRADYICINQPFTFEFGGKDADGDSLSYQLVTPYNGFSNRTLPNPQATGSSNYPLVQWAFGINLQNVIPGKQPLRINAINGQLSVNAGQLGLYVFSILVQEYRNKVKIGEVRRDFQLKVIDCINNDPPKVNLRETGKSAFYARGETIRIKASDAHCLNFLITDINPNQNISLAVRSASFSTKDVILTPSQATLRSEKDTLRASLCLGTCVESINGRELLFDVIASDDGCPLPRQDTLTVKIIVEPQPNAKPIASTDLTGSKASVVIGSTFRFNASGLDPDNDSLRLEAKGRGFVFSNTGMTFVNTVGKGKLTQPFTWTPTCTDVGKIYLVDFVAIDKRCDRNQRDSVVVQLTALPRPSQRPDVRTTLMGNTAELTVGSGSIVFDVIAEDPDNDPIQLYGQGRGFDMKTLGIKFDNKSGTGKIISPFSWTPSCDALQGKASQIYTIDFITEDNSCQPTRFDTVTVQITLKNLLANYEIKPPNVFTPNDDGKNDYFSVSNLPPDNCDQQFEGVEIFNRWGGSVFQSADRNFRWYGENFPTGEYFYLIKYTKQKYKGAVTLLK